MFLNESELLMTRDLNIAGRDNIVNHYYQNDKLKYFIQKKADSVIKEKVLNFCDLFINKHILDSRFSYSDYKYEELIDEINKLAQFNEEIDKRTCLFDDGYKSIIYCVVGVYDILRDFSYQNEQLIANFGEVDYRVKINNGSLVISPIIAFKKIEQVKSFDNFTSNLLKKINIYLECSLKTGNFFNFSKIEIEKIDKNMEPFETQMHISNKFIPFLMSPLYGDDPKIGIREIVQNAIDAETAIHQKTPIEIKVSDINQDRFIEIRDFGIGMSREEITNYYLTVGISNKSDNSDFIGKYGIGSLAFSLLGSYVEITTKKKNSDVIYEFSYSTETLTDFDNKIIVDIRDGDFSFGTRVKIKLKDSLQKLTERELKNRLKLMETFKFSQIDLNYQHFKNDKLIIKDTLRAIPKFISVDSNPNIKYVPLNNRSQKSLYYVDNVKLANLSGNLNTEQVLLSTGRPEYILVESKDYPINLTRDYFINKSAIYDIRQKIKDDWIKKRPKYLQIYINKLDKDFPVVINDKLAIRIPTIQNKELYGVYDGSLSQYIQNRTNQKVIVYIIDYDKKAKTNDFANSVIRDLSQKHIVICLSLQYFIKNIRQMYVDFVDTKNIFFMTDNLILTKPFSKLRTLVQRLTSTKYYTIESNITTNQLSDADINLIEEFFKLDTNARAILCGVYDIENFEKSMIFKYANKQIENEYLKQINIIRKK